MRTLARTESQLRPRRVLRHLHRPEREPSQLLREQQRVRACRTNERCRREPEQLLRRDCCDMLAEKLNIDPSVFRLASMRTVAYTDQRREPCIQHRVRPDYGLSVQRILAAQDSPRYGCGLQLVRQVEGWESQQHRNELRPDRRYGKKLRGVGMALTSGSKGSLSAPTQARSTWSRTAQSPCTQENGPRSRG